MNVVGQTPPRHELLLDAAARAGAANAEKSPVLTGAHDGHDDARGDEGGDEDEVGDWNEETGEGEAPARAEPGETRAIRRPGA